MVAIFFISCTTVCLCKVITINYFSFSIQVVFSFSIQVVSMFHITFKVSLNDFVYIDAFLALPDLELIHRGSSGVKEKRPLCSS